MSKQCRIGVLESDLCVHCYDVWYSELGARRLIPGLYWMTLDKSLNPSVTSVPFLLSEA